jgi:hypothetical protein
VCASVFEPKIIGKRQSPSISLMPALLCFFIYYTPINITKQAKFVDFKISLAADAKKEYNRHKSPKKRTARGTFGGHHEKGKSFTYLLPYAAA